MAKMQFQHTPLIKWPRKATPKEQRRKGLFVSKLLSTVSKLAVELNKLGAVNPILITTDHHGKNDIGISGLPREEGKSSPGGLVKASSPGVVIEFYAFRNGKDGDKEQMQFACDTYHKWQHNLHAIVLTLQSLRAIDRYGATAAGEQYAGFKALPGPTPVMTVETAANAVASIQGVGATAKMIIDSKQVYQEAYRVAVKKAHPDAAGDAELWKLVQSADPCFVRITTCETHGRC